MADESYGAVFGGDGSSIGPAALMRVAGAVTTDEHVRANTFLEKQSHAGNRADAPRLFAPSECSDLMEPERPQLALMRLRHG